MIVVKFGGSSLADPARMLAAARIVERHRREEPVVCVVSAMAGVTDQLLSIADLASAGTSAWRAPFGDLRDRHEQTLSALTPDTTAHPWVALEPIWDALQADAEHLATVAAAYALQQASAAFSAWGERLSVRLFTAALNHVGLQASSFEDAPVIVERDALSDGRRYIASVPATCAWLRDPLSNLLRLRMTPVLPGYLAMTQDGEYTTLGRNGSDYSAAVIGAALDASAVYLYSNVAGIFQADPRVVPQARLLPTLTYDEAASIADAGARVLHPATLPPLARRGIPLFLRSAYDPDAPGTDIGYPGAYGRFEPTNPASALPPLPVACAGGVLTGRPDAF